MYVLADKQTPHHTGHDDHAADEYVGTIKWFRRQTREFMHLDVYVYTGPSGGHHVCVCYGEHGDYMSLPLRHLLCVANDPDDFAYTVRVYLLDTGRLFWQRGT